MALQVIERDGRWVVEDVCDDGCECEPCTARDRGHAMVVQAALATEPFADTFPVPEYMPPEWLAADPSWIEPWRAEHGYPNEPGVLRLTVTDDGRAGGYFYERGVCILESSDPRGDECWEPTPSPTGYALFHQAHVVTADGVVREVGAIGNVGGHADPRRYPTADMAVRKYGDPNCQLLVGRCYDLPRGAYFAGAVIPGATFGDVALLRRSTLSGDWRPMPDEWWAENNVPRQAAAAADYYDCVGPTLVTRPGLPLVRRFRAAGARAVYLGGAGGVQLDQEDDMDVEQIIQETTERAVEATLARLGAAGVAVPTLAVVDGETPAGDEGHTAAPMPMDGVEVEGDPMAALAQCQSDIATLQEQVASLLADRGQSVAQAVGALRPVALPA